MGFRFQRSIKILPGLRMNLSKSGVGFSAGNRGAHMGVDAKGRRYTSLGVPGTGISWRGYRKGPPRRSGRPGLFVVLFLALVAVSVVIALLSGGK